jgi:predicted nucleic acid-binding protein
LRLRQWLVGSEPLTISAIVWAEFLCGPLTADQARIAASLFPDPEPVTASDAAKAADLFNASGRRRGSLMDCLIAATAVRVGATLATENVHDFERFQALGLKLVTA